MTAIRRTHKSLKVCPCCGAKASLFHKLKSLSWKVMCSKCGMRTCKLSSKAQAIKTWNRRNVVEKSQETKNKVITITCEGANFKSTKKFTWLTKDNLDWYLKEANNYMQGCMKEMWEI